MNNCCVQSVPPDSSYEALGQPVLRWDSRLLDQKEVAFDAALLKLGANVLKSSIPAGDVMNGVEYDYLRLEVGEM